MVDAAHGVIFQIDLDRPQHRAILKRYQEVVADDIPIVVVVRQGQKERFRELLAGVQTWETEPTISELDGFAAEVEAADWTRD
jgi:UDP-N-acetyl-D-mannosaminuronic acid transferase (WecB/TagA/CpsF family)